MEPDNDLHRTPLQQIARRVSEQLHGRGVLTPYWLVQAVVEQRLTDAHPLAILEMDGLDAETTEALATAITESMVEGAATPAFNDSPAVLDLDEAGRLIATLGVMTHCALINADQLQPAFAAILGRAASCLMIIGSAARDAHRAEDKVLLLPEETLKLARQAMAAMYAELRTGRWTVVGDEDARVALLALLKDEMSRLKPA